MKGTKELQELLNSFGYDAGNPDDNYGKRTTAAVKAFQTRNGLHVDGLAGPLTWKALLGNPKPAFDGPAPDRSIQVAPPVATIVRGPLTWPRQVDVARVFGAPGNPKCTAGTVKLPIAFRLAWDLDTKVNSFRCHELVAASMTRIFNRAVDHYGESAYRRLRLDLFGGCYNLRQMRGGSAWSMHSFGIAVDLDPERNALKSGRVATASAPAATFARPEYVPFWEIVESEGAISLGRERDFDWMHFQFARL